MIKQPLGVQKVNMNGAQVGETPNYIKETKSGTCKRRQKSVGKERVNHHISKNATAAVTSNL